MRRIKPKARVDQLVTEKRKPKKSYGRQIYLGLLGIVALGIADLAFGHLLYLDADGQVMQDNYAVATEHRGTVMELFVEEGTVVQKGDLLARIRSRDVLERLADLRSQQLTMQRDLNAMVSRREVLLATRTAALERSRILEESLRNTRDAKERGLVRADRLANAVDEAFTSMRDAQQVIADAKTIDNTIELMSHSLDELTEALSLLEDAYNNGDVLAAHEGLIANLNILEGAVVEPGDSLMEIYFNKPFVLAQVPTGTAYNLELEQEVVIQAGVESMSGRVKHIYPVASKLSEEFQRTFEPTDRRQLVRIDFMHTESDLPLFSKVQITTTALGRPFSRLAETVFRPRAYAESEETAQQ
ncbi:MAG: biotin/lipoyl-binding protein [Alphaproteobacteria bacterium]|nr:biotin/lipoyl-binding protein [Alphaproteobacteria bacterium SS10]